MCRRTEGFRVRSDFVVMITQANIPDGEVRRIARLQLSRWRRECRLKGDFMVGDVSEGRIFECPSLRVPWIVGVAIVGEMRRRQRRGRIIRQWHEADVDYLAIRQRLKYVSA